MAKQRRRGGRPGGSGAKPGGPGPEQSRPKQTRSPAAYKPPVPALVVDEGVLPPPGASFLGILRGESFVWWRSVLGVFFSLALFLLLISLVSQLVISVAWSTTGAGVPYADYFRQAAAFERPVGMLGANLAIMTLVVISAAMMLVVHQVRPRWLLSVEGRVRWRYLVICLVVALVALNGVLLLSSLVEGFPGFAVQSGFWSFLIVIVLTSPLQAVAEEVFFRGYLLQALGSIVAAPWFGIVVSSLIFAYVHGSQNLALFLDRLAFGLLAAGLGDVYKRQRRSRPRGRDRRARGQQRLRLRYRGGDHVHRRGQGDQQPDLQPGRVRRGRVRALRPSRVRRGPPDEAPLPGGVDGDRSECDGRLGLSGGGHLE